MSVPNKYFPRSLNEDTRMRPSTMNALESGKGLKRKAHTSLKVLSRMPNSSVPKDLDKDLLFKIKPKQVNIDKEQLFQDNMQLKLQNHSLQEELIKLKTKFSQVELELNKKDKLKENSGTWDKSQSVSLTQNLKQTIKDLKASLESKEKEMFKLRSNLKCSRTNELEAELQAYIDECTRLRHHLEETLKSKSDESNQDLLTAQALDHLQADKSRLETQNKSLQSQLNDLKSSIEDEKKRKKMIVRKVDVNQRSEMQKLKLVLQGRERELKEKEKEFKDREKDLVEKVEKLKSENSSLKIKLETALNKLRQSPSSFLVFKPNAPTFFRIVNVCVGKLKGLKEFLEGLKMVKSMSQIFEYVKGIYPQVKQSQVVDTMELFRLKKPEGIYDLVKEWFPLYDYTTENPELEHEVSKSVSKQQKSEVGFENKEMKVSEPTFTKVFKELVTPKKEEIEEVKQKIEKKEEIPFIVQEKIQPLPIKEEKKTPKSVITPTKSKNQPEIQVQPLIIEHGRSPNNAISTPKDPKPFENHPKTSKSEGKRPITKASTRKPQSSQKFWDKVAMCLQIHRLSKDEFINFLPEEISKKTVCQLFISEPFKFSSKDSKSFTKSIFSSFGSKNKKYVIPEEIFELFKENTEDWQIFTQEQEDEFNTELSEMVENFKSEILEQCSKIDSLNSGIVTIDEFQGILRALKISLTSNSWKYAKLLFYSCNEILDQVPYVYFLDNFGKEENESDEEGDQVIASKVRKYIEKIAEKLIDANLTVSEAFQHSGGNINPTQFLLSLEKLGINDIPEEDVELMVQALQDENSDEACILLEELADILNNYGVAEEPAGTLVQNSISKDQDTFKIENSEDNYQDDYEEYSEDSNT